jgi:hypothetical protein
VVKHLPSCHHQHLTAEAYDCLHAIPFNSTVREQTLDTLQKAYPLFAFLDIAAKPPAVRLMRRVCVFSLHPASFSRAHREHGLLKLTRVMH